MYRSFNKCITTGGWVIIACLFLLMPRVGQSQDLSVLGHLNVASNLLLSGVAHLAEIHVEGGSGDVDANGMLTSSDQAVLFDYLTGSTSLSDAQAAILDVNGDAKVSRDDLAVISQLMGLTVGTPTFNTAKATLLKQVGEVYGLDTNMSFRVSGTAMFEKIMLSQPSGDIPMGIFTQTSNP